MQQDAEIHVQYCNNAMFFYVAADISVRHWLRDECCRVRYSAFSRWLPTAAAQGSSPGLVMWDLWWTKRRWGRFSPSTSVSLANLHSTNCSAIILIYHLGFVQ
jgi:hypothetical protein